MLILRTNFFSNNIARKIARRNKNKSNFQKKIDEEILGIDPTKVAGAGNKGNKSNGNTGGGGGGSDIPWGLIAGIGGGAAALGIGGSLLYKRNKRKRELESDYE